MVFLITYDLHRPVQNYAALYKAIKALGPWAHPLESTWLVDTELPTATAVDAWLSSHIDANDRMLVIGVSRDYQGWLPKVMWEWLNGRTFLRAA